MVIEAINENEENKLTTIQKIKEYVSPDATENGMSLGALYSAGITLWRIGIAFYNSSSLAVGLDDLWPFILSGILIALISACSLLLLKILDPEKVRLPFALGALASVV